MRTKAKPKTHDFTRTKQRLLHWMNWEPADTVTLMVYGAGMGIAINDYVLLTDPASGYETRYRVEEIGYKPELPNEFVGRLRFAPRGMH